MSTLSQVLSLGVGTETDILAAMNNVNDVTSIDEIVNYLLDGARGHIAVDAADLEDEAFDEKAEFTDAAAGDWDELPEEPLPVVAAPQQDFMLHCHKCDTWLESDQSVSDVCVECFDFRKLPSSFIKPGVFTYRPGHKADIVLAGYVRQMRCDMGGADISALCLNFLRGVSFDRWHYPLMRIERNGLDISINDLNNRVQFRADELKWRSVFTMRAIHSAMRAEYRLVAVCDIKCLEFGLIPAAEACEDNVTRALSTVDGDEAMRYRCAVSQDDEIRIIADLKAGFIEFEINGYEVKKVDVVVAETDIFKFGVSLRKQYDAVELVECALSEWIQ